MTAVYLAGVALAALLSENFILVNCLGIGTRTQAFDHPLEAGPPRAARTAGLNHTPQVARVGAQRLFHICLV